ncbi:MAG: hypothetical protein IPM39_02315 [Chloroflexi bacterium]|nr:hypothetical protein [Chloroflexota bacterium]
MQDLRFETWKIEVAIPNFLLRASFQPRGDMMIYLNNQTYTSFNFTEVELLPLAADYQVKGIKQPLFNVNRSMMEFVSILEADKASQIQLLQSKRRVVFYTSWFAVRGDLHVNSEAPDESLLDDKFDFFMLTDATIFPLRPLNAPITQKAPAVAFNRKAILAHHTHKSQT